MSKRRTWTLGGLTALVVTALLWWLWPTSDLPPSSAAVSPAYPAGLTPFVGLPHGGPQDPKPVQPAAAGPRPRPPIVDEVILEKEEVCVGEENLVTVRAHTVDGADDAHLHAVIGGQPGMQVALRARRQSIDEPTTRLVTVFGRNNVATTVELPPFTVKDCTVERQLIIERRLRPNTNAEFDFRARIVERGAEQEKPFVPLRYEWSFGDGNERVTATPHAVHSYDHRPQDAMYSHYLVRARALAGDGREVTGRSGVQLRNMAYVNLVYTNTVTLMVDLTPRLPVRGDDGTVRQKVRLWHHRREPVLISQLWRRRNFNDGSPPASEEIEVTDLLGRRSIPPSGTELELSLDSTAEPQLFSVDYLLRGQSVEGIPVAGAFSVMVPPPPPTPESSVPVRDPLFRAKIKRAMELLNKRFVSEEEMQRLHLRGAFDDLEVAKTAGPPAAPTYRDLPPHPPRGGEPPPDTPLVRGDELPALEANAPRPR